jgi:hypothetical protein
VTLVGSLLFVAAGTCVLRLGEGMDLYVDPRVAWGTIVFFGGIGLLFLRPALDSRPRLVIDDSGVLDRTLKLGLIPWAEIQGACLEFIHGEERVCLQVRNQKGSAAKSAPGFSEVTLDLTGLSMATEDVLSVIQRRTLAHGGNRR